MPRGLGAGDKFRLLFVSKDGRTVWSRSMSQYNQWIQDQVDSGHPDIQRYSSHFRLLGSTSEDDARDNTRTTYTSSNKGVPIYWLGGDKVADDYEDFYDGTTWDSSDVRDEHGESRRFRPVPGQGAFSGSNPDGTHAFIWEGGATRSRGLGSTSNLVRLGGNGTLSIGQDALLSQVRSLYGLSLVFEIAEPASVSLGWSLIPAGLVPGDLFRLLFVSSTLSNAQSSDIGEYNTRVQNLAAAGHADIRPYSAGFRVVGSTAAVDARDNLNLESAPVYWLNGSKVANDVDDFFDESWENEDDARNELGNHVASPGDIWTGSEDNGTEAFDEHGNSRALGASAVRYGQLDIGRPTPFSASDQTSASNRRLYALSGLLQVARVVVPANWGLLPAGLETGDRFRLLFVTSGTRSATASQIADYNAFVRRAARAGHADIKAYSEEFRAVGSTASVDAIDNTETAYTTADKGYPIYWLDGSKVADEYEDFYDGEWASTEVRDESGAVVTVPSGGVLWVATGSDDDGTESSSNLTSFALGENAVAAAAAHSMIRGDASKPLRRAATSPDAQYAVYGLSRLLEVVANNAPEFSVDMASRSIAENSSGNVDVGDPVTATDDDNETLTYSLGGAAADAFDINASTGQIRTKAGVLYDHESSPQLEVTVTADDGNTGGKTELVVTIAVTDQLEPPLQPSAPGVDPVPGKSDSLAVTWTAPDNSGRPPITSYDLQYREAGTGAWTPGPQGQSGHSVTFVGLQADTGYEVQVRATNAEGTGGWSPSGSGKTYPPNRPPAYRAGTAEREVPENSPPGHQRGDAPDRERPGRGHPRLHPGRRRLWLVRHCRVERPDPDGAGCDLRSRGRFRIPCDRDR